MSQLINQLKVLETDTFILEDGEPYQAKLLSGLSEAEVLAFTALLPLQTLPNEVKQLLLFARGFEFDGLEEVRFDAFGEFGLCGLFPYCIELASDGFGNYWVLDIFETGGWGAVFFVCHDPQVIVRQSGSLLEFLSHVQQFGNLGVKSQLNQVHEDLTTRVWQQRKMQSGLIKAESESNPGDIVLQEFASNLPIEFLVADLRKNSSTQGFALDQISFTRNKIRKHPTEPIWGFEMPIKERNWLKRLLSR